MKTDRPNKLYYRIAQSVSWIAAKILFKRKFIRNEIKRVKGPYVVIANHQTMLDFVNLIGASRRPMSFVISNSIYSTLPIKGFLKKMGVIPKQQFQTASGDLKKMKAVIARGEPVVIYPAGLMCEDGLSTPIPAATYKFLKWLKADVYVARASGTYFVMPKWAKGIRPGKTYMDIYKLFSKEELEQLDIYEVKQKTDEALLFDAYREQEEFKCRYRKNNNIAGLENVLYMCPNCRREFTIRLKDNHTLCCSECGFEEYSDKLGFLHVKKGTGEEIRYVSDWSRIIYNELKTKIINGEVSALSAETEIMMIDQSKNKFVTVGRGTVTLDKKAFTLAGTMNGRNTELFLPIVNVPSLPFGPGKYFEIQNGMDIYRCMLKDGSQVMKFINMVKIFYKISKEEQGNETVSEATATAASCSDTNCAN